MKITRLQAENVHGYLPLDVTFFDDLTFLTGLNGSGKTTVLRLLMALLTPTIEDLGAIVFTSATVTVRDGDTELSVRAEKLSEGITIGLSDAPDELLLVSIADLELLMDTRRRDEVRSPITDKYLQNAIFQRIKSISTPMFLGLDRRFYAPGMLSEDLAEARRREYVSRRFYVEEPTLRGSAMAALAEVNYLVLTRLQEVRVAQEQLDETLRAQFFTKAFEYKPADFTQAPVRVPSSADIAKYRAQLATIERKAEGAKIPVPEIQSALSTFFERMSKIVESMQKDVQQPPRGSKKKPKKGTEPPVAYVEWIINKPQADRILEHLGMLERYLEQRNALHDPINRFLSLLNGFFKQTHKVVAVVPSGHLTVSLHGKSGTRPISALSSGERQLLVMLAHLSLNPNLSGSGVFIVDEPELSLHIHWQEKFVDAVREANPKVQLILATHSPAIILDRVESCLALDQAANA